MNIWSNIKEQVASRVKAFHTRVQHSIEEWSRKIQFGNAKMISITQQFGKERARLIDMSEWTKGEKGLQVLDDVVHWLGFRGFAFNSLYHELTATPDINTRIPQKVYLVQIVTIHNGTQ